MFDALRKVISENIPSFSENKITESDHIKKVQIATCAVLLEIANADEEFTSEEKAKVIKIMQKTFNISEDYIHELIELAEKKIENSISVYEFTDSINNYFTQDEKFEMLINLWKLIYIDDTLDKHEDHLAKRIGNNFNFSHKQIMDAKLIAKQEMGK